MNYENFYETVKEANMRLRGTVVMYDGLPYHVAHISDHMKDGVWRIYLDEFGSRPYCQYRSDGIPLHHYAPGDGEVAALLDHWLENISEPRMLRKMMNSPKFNGFKPFPLGYVAYREEFLYCERHPTRKTEQGLTQNALVLTSIMTGENVRAGNLPFHSDQVRATILGDYHTKAEAWDFVTDPTTANKMVAFNRDFAFMRGPVDTTFLTYKTDAVGLMTGEHSVLLGNRFKFLKEVVENLNEFKEVK